MNALMWKRRWYVARPWVLDGLAGLGLIAAMAVGFKFLDFCAFLCRAWEFCS